jgi:hypothetical protein
MTLLSVRNAHCYQPRDFRRKVRCTQNSPFYTMALDLAFEQANANVKGDGAVVDGMNDNPNALQR